MVEGFVSGQDFLMVASPNPGKSLTLHIAPFENISRTTAETSAAGFSLDEVLNIVPLLKEPFSLCFRCFWHSFHK